MRIVIHCIIFHSSIQRALEAKHQDMLQDIQAQKDELRRQRESHQKQIDLWSSKMENREGTLPKNASAPGISHHSMEQSAMDTITHRDHSPSDNTSSHRRSASEDFCHAIEEDLARFQSGTVKTRRDLPHRTDSRASNSSFTSSANKSRMPEHLLSAKNEQKVAGSSKTSRSGLTSSGGAVHSTGSGGKGTVQQVLPFKLSSGGGSNSSLSGLASSPGNTGNSPQNSTHASHQRHPLSNRGNLGSKSSNSSLSLLMKLAEPGNKQPVRSSSLTSSSNLLSDKSQTPSKSTSMDVPSSSAGSGDQGSNQVNLNQSGDKDSEIYC